MSESITAPRLTKSQIRKRAEALFLGYADTVGHEIAKLGVNFDRIFENYIYPEYEIELIEDQNLGSDDDGEKILGFFEPQFNQVFIDRGLKYDPRRIFTCWHEFGHALLHGDWLRNEFPRMGVVTTESMLSRQEENTLEWQANYFAANAASPLGFVDYVIENTLKLVTPLRFQGPGTYTFDVRGRTQFRKVATFEELCSCVAFYIKHRFGGLSVESLSYRVAQSNMIADATRFNRPNSGLSLKRTTRSFKKRSSRQSLRVPELMTAAR